MEIRNVIELSAFSKSLSKKITYLNHEERILIDIEQIAAITPTSEREDSPKKVGLASGKVGTRYNVIKIPKEEKGRVIRKTVIDNGTVGRRLTDEEFVNMYPSQCNIFKEIFKEEFQVASQKIQKTKR